jgi:acyl-CoA thioester hydrolase
MLEDFPVVVQQSVVWGEMDAFQHVNNVVYFRYFENVRIEYFQQIGWTELQKATGQGPILASIEGRFKRPLNFPDTITIGARVLHPLGVDRLTMEYAIASAQRNAIVTEGKSLIVSYDYFQLQKVPLPEAVRQRILELEAWG